MNFFSRQIDQIFVKTELKFFVWTLTIINLSTALYWKFSNFNLDSLSSICWPMFANCDNFASFASPYLLSCLIVTCIVTLVFLLLRLNRLIFPLLTLSFLIKLSIYLLNYSFSNNIHALILLLEICLFLFPLKSTNLKFLILLFILWSGVSKLNMNWLSGLEIKSYLPQLPIKGIEWISAVIVILELVTPFILLSKMKLIFNYAWAMLTVYFVGYAYISGDFIYIFPAILIIFLVVLRQCEIGQERRRLYQSYLTPEPTKTWLAVPFILFAIFQWVPGLTHPLPLFSKTPFSFQLRKVPSTCFSKTIVKGDQSTFTMTPELEASNGSDFNCHPSKFQNFTETCLKYKNITKNTLIYKVFYSKELTNEKFNKVFETTYDCQKNKAIN